MTRVSGKSKVIVDRLDIVSLYLSRNMAVTTFTRLYNAGDISRQLLEDTGPIEAEDLDRWADLCAGLAAEGPPKEPGGDGPFVESLNRYIGALEGNLANQAEMIRELRDRLAGLLPQK
jgi:hypothetical protein